MRKLLIVGLLASLAPVATAFAATPTHTPAKSTMMGKKAMPMKGKMMGKKAMPTKAKKSTKAMSHKKMMGKKTMPMMEKTSMTTKTTSTKK